MAKRKIRATTGDVKIRTQAVGLEGGTFYAATGRVIEGEEAALKKLMESHAPGTFEWVDEVKSSAPKTSAKGSGGKG